MKLAYLANHTLEAGADLFPGRRVMEKEYVARIFGEMAPLLNPLEPERS